VISRDLGGARPPRLQPLSLWGAGVCTQPFGWSRDASSHPRRTSPHRSHTRSLLRLSSGFPPRHGAPRCALPQFPLYERIKVELAAREPDRRLGTSAASHRGGGDSTPPPPPPPSPISHVIAASAISKLVASTITYPHEVIRARLQFDKGGKVYSGLVDATRKTLRNDGLRGLWLGFQMNIVRTIPQCVITFTVYEYFSRRLQAAFSTYDSESSEETDAARTRRRNMMARTRSESRG
jgi:hypothetical protein